MPDSRHNFRNLAAFTSLVMAAALAVSACVSDRGPAPTPSPRPLPSPTSAAPPPTATPAPRVTPTRGQTPGPTATSTPRVTLTRGQTPGPTATPAAAPSPEATTLPAPTLAPEVLALLAEIERRVVEERGLNEAKEAQRRIVSKDELRRMLGEQFKEEEDLEEMEITQALLITVGLLEEGQDLRQLLIDLRAGQVAGQFNLETGELNIVSEGEFGILEEWTYAHEYAHALQQGTFDILHKRESVEDDSEASAALTALIEGDATLLAALYTTKYLSFQELSRAAAEAGDSEGLDEAPLVLRESLFFPYTAGVSFTVSLFQQGGWSAINQAYADPPVTTEQILHPEKYTAREGPLEVTLPEIAPSLGEGWELADEETFGEFDLTLLLRLHISDGDAQRAAAGWGGDRYAFLRGPEGQAAFVDHIRWDTPQDAEEFFEAYEESLERQGAVVAGGDTALDASTDDRVHVLRLKVGETLLIIATEPGLAERILPLFDGF